MVELWGGVECTVNRVGGQFFDQLVRTGHAERIDDLDRFARLGVAALRYPVLWERIAPDGVQTARWEWADRRLERLRKLGIRPIVGLVHHGSGPAYTDLLDRDFPEKLAEYALAVARRYPWVTAFTPVNEPLTTARFSGLYGLWYPHRRDSRAFLRMLVNQCRGVALAMQAIRSVTPNAELVQTEDAGETFSVSALDYQAQYENHRRLLGFDLLCGRVVEGHPLWKEFVRARRYGLSMKDVEWLAEAGVKPDVIGVNYYLTSDRVLDRRVSRYPAWSHGGNHRHRYADVAAVHAWPEGISGFYSLLTRLHQRYGSDVAITEVHLGCTREEQMRWLWEAWTDAQRARSEGVPVRAVTVWSLLGAFDWNKLVTEENGFYESGAFDLRGGTPRPTALAEMMQSLSQSGKCDHPVLESPGWWRRPERLSYSPVREERRAVDRGALETTAVRGGRPIRRPLLILGAMGTLGRAFARTCDVRGLVHVGRSRQEVDITDAAAVERVLREVRPWAVINAAGYVRVDDAEQDEERCLRVNVSGAATLAAVCASAGIQYVTFSSDLVFDGGRTSPYLESHPVAPLNVYGRSKALAEREVLAAMPEALVIRTSAFFGPWDDYNFVTVTLGHMAQGRAVRASTAVVSPTYVPDLVDTSLDLLLDKAHDVWHVANQGAVTWAELARMSAHLAGMDPMLVEECCEPVTLGHIARRPMYSALASERGALLPALEDSLGRYLHEYKRERGGFSVQLLQTA